MLHHIRYLNFDVILECCRQYIGEHIRCLTGSQSIPEHVVNTFCYFTTTFTVIRHFNETQLQLGVIPHPGVGPMRHEEEIQHHAYYQWVPFFLFAKSIFFYLPYLFWKSFEGMTISFVYIIILQYSLYALCEW